MISTYNIFSSYSKTQLKTLLKKLTKSPSGWGSKMDVLFQLQGFPIKSQLNALSAKEVSAIVESLGEKPANNKKERISQIIAILGGDLPEKYYPFHFLDFKNKYKPKDDEEIKWALYALYRANLPYPALLRYLRLTYFRDLKESYSSFVELFNEPIRALHKPHKIQIVAGMAKALKQANAPWIESRTRYYRVFVWGYDYEVSWIDINETQSKFWRDTDLDLAEHIFGNMDEDDFDSIPEEARIIEENDDFARYDIQESDGRLVSTDVNDLGIQIIEICNPKEYNERNFCIVDTVFNGYLEEFKERIVYVKAPKKPETPEKPDSKFLTIEITIGNKGSIIDGIWQLDHDLILSNLRLKEEQDECLDPCDCFSYQNGEEILEIETDLNTTWPKWDEVEIV